MSVNRRDAQSNQLNLSPITIVTIRPALLFPLLLLRVLGTLSPRGRGSEAASAKVGQPSTPPFRLKVVEGGSRSVLTLRGKPRLSQGRGRTGKVHRRCSYACFTRLLLRPRVR